MTEEEAKTKWCPFARSYGFPAVTHNRDADGEPAGASYCIGSDCMAWRWKSVVDGGFCGLVGKP